MERNYEFLCTFAHVKKNTGSVVFVLAFILLWACTPSALFKHTAPTASVDKEVPISVPKEIPVREAPEEVPQVPVEVPPSAPEGATIDLPTDSLSADSLIAIPDSMTIGAPSGAEGGASEASSSPIARAAMKRDTTTMD